MLAVPAILGNHDLVALAVDGVKSQSAAISEVAKAILYGHFFWLQSEPVNPGSHVNFPVVGSFAKAREVLSVMMSRR